MIFRPELVTAIRAGWKTQTRRLVKDGDYAVMARKVSMSMGLARMDEVRGRPGNRLRWKVGRVYWAQPGRGKMGVCRFKLLSIRREPVQSITDEDARAEGMGSIHPVIQFIDVWNGIHKDRKSWANNPMAWVLDFDLLPQDKSG